MLPRFCNPTGRVDFEMGLFSPWMDGEWGQGNEPGRCVGSIRGLQQKNKSAIQLKCIHQSSASCGETAGIED